MSKSGITEAYVDDIVIAQDRWYQPVRIVHQVVGVIDTGHFVVLPTDHKGTLLSSKADLSGVNIPVIRQTSGRQSGPLFD